MSTNILSLKALEKRFSSLIQNLNEAVLVENENREILLVNQAFCNMFAPNMKPKQMVGINCENAAEESKLYFENPEKFVKRVSEILKDKTIVINEELKMVNGIYLERDYVPVFLDDKYLGHMWKYRDVTQSKKLIQELLDSKKEIEKTNESLKEFGYIVSHDLKAPLRGVASLCDWIIEDLEEYPNQEVKDNLKLLQSRVTKMSNLVTGILNYSKTGLEHTEFKIIDTQKELHSLVDDFRDKFVNIEVENEIPQIKVMKVPFFQVFANLLSNAIKHNDKERAEIKIGYKENSSHHIFNISDNGPGIPEKDYQEIFKLFKTLHTKNYSLNSGVGLSIVKKIIDTHKGEIKVSSELGKGTTFEFSVLKNL